MSSRVLIFLLAIITFAVSCKKNEEEDYYPPKLNIVEQDTTGTLGRLKCKIFYKYKEGTVKDAPAKTEIQVYTSSYDLEYGYTLYKTWVSSSSSEVDFGYLHPGYYYVVAFKQISGYQYETTNTVIVNANMSITSDIIMEKKVTN